MVLLLALFLLVAGAPLHGQEVLFSDHFHTLAEGQRPSDSQWQVVAPTAGNYWVGRDGALFSGNLLGQAPSYVLVNTAGSSDWRDVRITADFTMGHDSGSVLLSLRARDSRNQYIAYLTVSTGSGGERERSVEIVKLTNGIPLPLAQLGADRGNLPPFERRDTTWRMAFEARGDNLIVSLEGNEVLRASDSSYPTGKAGVGAGNTTVSFDFVAVTPAGVAAPLPPDLPGPEAAGAPDGAWRVLLRDGMTRQQADRMRSDLEDGFDDVAVFPRGGSHAVYVGSYASEEQARASIDRYIAEGLIPRAIERVGGDADSSGRGTAGYRVLVGLYNTRQQAEARANEIQYEEGFFPVSVLSDGNSHKVFLGETFPSREEAEAYAQALLAEGVAQVGVYRMGEREAIDLAYIADAASSNAGAGLSRDDRDRVVDLFAEMERLRREGAQEERRQVEESVRSMGAEQQRFLQEMEELRGQSDVITEGGRELGVTPGPTRRPPRASAADLVRARKAEALRLEEEGDFSGAIQTWNLIKATDPSGQSLNEANEAISRLQRAIDEETLTPRAATSTASGDGVNPALIGGIILVLVIAGGVVFFVMKKKGAAKPARPSSSSSTVTPIPSLGRGTNPAMKSNPATPIPSRMTGASPDKKAPAPAKPAPSANSRQEEPAEPEEKHEIVGASARIRPGVMSPAPPKEEEAAAVTGQKSGEEESISLSSLGMGGDAGTAGSAAPRKQRASVGSPKSKPAPAPPKDEPAPAEAEPAKSKDFYEQSFDGEPVGSVPSNWKSPSDYDYASLTIVERPEGGRCMRFEKHSGTGSAYYSCRFPDASGRFHVEFDICCADKNKYLLGFYIEKDEDFRQSVSTVIHRDTSRNEAVTLRLQNEVTPYEFNKWRRVRFLVDLPRHIVDAYVDGEAIALGIRLNSRPEALNTLSIRDNLATEGVLMIDNIRISPVE